MIFGKDSGLQFGAMLSKSAAAACRSAVSKPSEN